MTTRQRYYAVAAFAIIAVVLAFFFVFPASRFNDVPPTRDSVTTVRYGVSPFQDTYLPVFGERKGWYKEEGIDAEFRVLGWTEVMEALSAGQVDVAINNMESVIATHARNPEIIYWYGMNPFDNGFALMIRPNSSIKPLAEIERNARDHAEAVRLTAAQLKGKTVITTSKTDMEQGVAAAAQKGGLDFRKDVRIIDLNPDEGLAAFLGGEGDAYIGGIPQRTRAGKEGMLEMLTGADLGPPPINGIVTTKTFAKSNPEALLKILRVWFRTVNYMNENMDEGAQVIVQELNSRTGSKMTVADFKLFWNNYEHYPASPQEVQDLIIAPSGRNYWKARWDDSNAYFVNVTKVISTPIDPKSAVWLEQAQQAYVAKYGSK